jgi:uncharacterized protein (DUF58 family)
MRIEPPKSAASPLMWFAVAGAPLAWVVEFALGYWATQTACSVPGDGWDVHLNAWGIVLMAISFVVAIAAGLTAVGLFRGTEGADVEESPPAGRVRFLATVGMTVTVLFTFIIVMTGLGIVILPDCHQS